MKIFNFNFLSKIRMLAVLVLVAFLTPDLNAQETNGEGVIRCFAVEVERSNLGDDYEKYKDAFEEYVRKQRANLEASESNTIYTIPVIFHVIHDNEAVGTGDNIEQQYIDSQIEQLNNDFRKIMGTSGDGGGVDTRIEFCAATVDENGNTLAEPGINRIDRNTKGWTAPPYGTPVLGCFFGANFDYVDNTIKPNSIWNPEAYMNVWVLDLVCGTLGYAQFPEAASLPGIGTGNGGANTDGVVVLSGSVGSTANPQAGGQASFNEGRTLTHEVGHFFGLRHIWGDGGCDEDDFCDDTPVASSSTSGCPTGKDSCPNEPGLDQIENYMDYSHDACMDRFTQDQTDRMLIVMGETGMGSPRRAILASSTVCGATQSCQDDLVINDDPIAADTYQANNTITSEGRVASSTTVTFEAGQSITLSPDFRAENGSTFTARIQACTGSSIANKEEEILESRTAVKISDNQLDIFPNPTNEETTIRLDLATESTVSLQLYDLTGRVIKQLANNKVESAGRHDYYINASDLEAGIYVVMLKVGEEMMTKKLSIIK